jgi:hypothetical protein
MPWAELLLLFKHCVIKTVKALKKQLRSDLDFNLKASERLASAINILRELNEEKPDLSALQELIIYDSNIRNLVHKGHLNSNKEIQEKVAEMINKLSEECRVSDIKSESKSKVTKFNLLKKLKKVLPSQRKYFSQLRRDIKEIPTTNPQLMAEIAFNFWKNKWFSHGSNYSKIRHILSTFNRKFDAELSKIDEDMVEEIIDDTKNTAVGPDGIPFAIYRMFKHIVKPIFVEVLQKASKGATAPKGFNHNLLYILPKSDSDIISESRPINVGNCDARILANIIRKHILPALEQLISPQQKAYLPGRNISDHVRMVNETFYEAKDKGLAYDMIFVDFSKAFDSLDHNFLEALLRKVGFHDEVINMISYLFHDLCCLTTFHGATQYRIEIEKGIKQGCPLSPLLFNLALEVLDNLVITHATKLKVDLIRALYADDVCYGSSNLQKLIPALAKIFEGFAEASGLKLNLTKTCIISTNTAICQVTQLRAILDRVGWNEVKISDRIKYLGILLGNDIDIYEIFDQAVTKLTNRVNSFMHLKKCFSVPRRILIANTFIIPILSYVSQFFALPWYHTMEVERQLSRWVVPGFKPFPLSACYRPAKWLNIKQPLRDITGENSAALASNFLRNPDAEWPHQDDNLTSIGKILTTSPRINSHIYGAVKFFEEYGINVKDCVSRKSLLPLHILGRLCRTQN